MDMGILFLCISFTFELRSIYTPSSSHSVIYSFFLLQLILITHLQKIQMGASICLVSVLDQQLNYPIFIFQLLNAVIGNHVEIGANTCIDRGSWRDTVIGDHSKLDNLVQIGHNVVIGKGCMLCGQVGIAGSVTMGDYVTLGGRVAIRDHVSIASKVRLAANSCATKDITEPGDYGGFPAVPIHEWRRQVACRYRISKKAISIELLEIEIIYTAKMVGLFPQMIVF
ncbi:hypothetical protein OIU84_014181 [Salix udensis]|uniref:UDP-3-O-[3-hydroxymyristoyl] glucosamine N-acyltransferase n=1 Tax=Salix udensis TaxID=889485 RepID=A0AAD6JBR3_9ROSI|nr:hypothetical protein OIU84_014181 [Salix udensis]